MARELRMPRAMRHHLLSTPRSYFFVLALPALAGCTKQLPPPPAPAPFVPTTIEETESDSARPETQTSSVLITTDIPAKVERSSAYLGRASVVPRTRQWQSVCESTPCSVRLDRGDYVLHFTALADTDRTSTTTVTVREREEIINHALGQERRSIGTVAGAALIVAGVACMVFPFGFDLDQKAPPPAAFVGVGIGAIFGGLTVMAIDPTLKQHGATTHWAPESPPRSSSKGVSFRLTF